MESLGAFEVAVLLLLIVNAIPLWIMLCSRKSLIATRNTVETHVTAVPVDPTGRVEILRTNGERVGIRTPGHPDIDEALRTPGLAVRWPSGDLDLGNQESAE